MDVDWINCRLSLIGIVLWELFRPASLYEELGVIQPPPLLCCDDGRYCRNYLLAIYLMGLVVN
jgi:hypothetical protein